MGGAQQTEDDAALIERTLGGDASAFEKLVRRYEGRVYRTTLGVTGNAEDAEEATQDTFVRAHQHLGEFRGEARFSTWAHPHCLQRRASVPSSAEADGIA